MGEQGRGAEWHQMDRLFPYAKVFWIKLYAKSLKIKKIFFLIILKNLKELKWYSYYAFISEILIIEKIKKKYNI